jgi:hypothetical protein
MNLLERKIGLSVRALREGEDPDRGWTYTPEVGTASIGEIIGEQLDQFKRKSREPEDNEDDQS